jgi:hypothetical protein
MAKNFILFGAGASFGSDNNGVPPLGMNLFSALCQFNPSTWGSLTQSYASTFRDDFEKGMLKVATERPHDLPILLKAMSAFFYNFKPFQNNLYLKLANKLKVSNKQIAFSSLNYERFFEISFNSAGHKLCIGGPINNGFELNLPHGCCNLFCESVKATAGAVNFSGIDVQTNGEIKFVSDTNEFQNRINNDAFPPVMSYFEPQKRSTSGHKFLLSQRSRYQELVNEAEKIIIIGVKIRDHDTHIWDPIKNSNGKLVYCSGSSEQNQFDFWTNSYRINKQSKFINGFWSDKFDDVFEELI